MKKSVESSVNKYQLYVKVGAVIKNCLETVSYKRKYNQILGKLHQIFLVI